MERKILFINIVVLILFIFVLNTIASYFYWYFSIWYFDMPMHFLGGFWLGLLLLWVLNIKEYSLKNIFKIILWVLCIGLLWEFFEFVVNEQFAKLPFDTIDTISDIFFDLSGGFASLLYFFSGIFNKIIHINKNSL